MALCTTTSEEASNSSQETETEQVQRRKNSFVWKYFRAVSSNNKKGVYECVICNACVAKTASNLARHLVSHDIVKHPTESIRNRQSRSFIWKYCTKEDAKHARCHLCNKLLYFGGGNTSNISKHLRRMHQSTFDREMNNMRETDTEETENATASITKREMANGDRTKHVAEDATAAHGGGLDNTSSSAGRKERKGMSYVWNYCEKLSRHSIRCNLCNKTMSFHGTANVITHLQRRHNIMGRVDSDINESAVENEPMNSIQLDLSTVEPQDDENCDQQIEEFVNSIKRRKRSAASISIVWRYCTRIGRDAVRCKFCNKNLSYQGTSNLQRHLHRMHGVVTRGPKDNGENEEQQSEITNTDFIWEHCTICDNENAKCNMCTSVFNIKQIDNIVKHLTIVHAVTPGRQTTKQRKSEMAVDSTEDSSGDDYENWEKMNTESIKGASNDLSVKKDDSFYNDIIVEEHDITNYDEDPFDENMLHDVPLANPLSPQSSNSDFRESTSKMFQGSKRLQELNEERLRMETEYFREKAGFYRMQKYLTALQAKKVRFEIERMQTTNNNGAFNGTYATISLEGIQQNLPT